METEIPQTNPIPGNVSPAPPPGDYTNLIPVETPQTKRGVWPFWPTIGFGAIIFTGWAIIQTLVTMPFIIKEIINSNLSDFTNIAQNLIQDSFYVALVTMISAPVGIGLIILFIKLRGNITLKEYLGLRLFKKKHLLIFFGILIVFFILNIYLEKLFPQLQSADSTIGSYTGSGLILFGIAAVIFAPIFEESFFRGFLFAGFYQSRIGAFGAIILTSIFFAVLHFQYGAAGILIIFVLAVFLGIVRLVTKSLIATISFHALWNLGAIVQIILYLNGVGN